MSRRSSSIIGLFLVGVLAGTYAGCTSGGGGGFIVTPKDGGTGGGEDMATGGGGNSCSNKKQDGAETDVDCGGGTCAKCAVGLICQGNADCETNRCVNGKCAPIAASCMDRKQNGDETDVDCGGKDCPACGDNKGCAGNTDCLSKVCLGGKCISSCTDTVQNGSETDVDCGGGGCQRCGNGKGCKMATDCVSGFCDGGVCGVPPANCMDGSKNGNETDTDCGGNCAPCADGKVCGGNADCQSNMCSGGTCAKAPTCNDGVKNGAETDVDCGGGKCATCANGKKCAAATDCTSKNCMNGTCQAMQANVGCGAGLSCYSMCQDNTCAQMCYDNITTANGQSYFDDFLSCLFDFACPVSNGGVCDNTALNYNQANCTACLRAAQMQGGKCYTELQTCLNDK